MVSIFGIPAKPRSVAPFVGASAFNTCTACRINSLTNPAV